LTIWKWGPSSGIDVAIDVVAYVTAVAAVAVIIEVAVAAAIVVAATRRCRRPFRWLPLLWL
jgi:hypothetical protein